MSDLYMDAPEWQGAMADKIDLTVCPLCNEPLVHANVGDGTIDTYCENCGWPDDSREEEEEVTDTTESLRQQLEQEHVMNKEMSDDIQALSAELSATHKQLAEVTAELEKEKRDRRLDVEAVLLRADKAEKRAAELQKGLDEFLMAFEGAYMAKELHQKYSSLPKEKQNETP